MNDRAISNTLIVQPHNEPPDNVPLDPLYPKWDDLEKSEAINLTREQTKIATESRNLQDYFRYSGYHVSQNKKRKGNDNNKAIYNIISYSDRVTALNMRLANVRTLEDELENLDHHIFPNELKLRSSNDTSIQNKQKYKPTDINELIKVAFDNGNDNGNDAVVTSDEDDQDPESDHQEAGDYGTYEENDGYQALEDTATNATI